MKINIFALLSIFIAESKAVPLKGKILQGNPVSTNSPMHAVGVLKWFDDFRMEFCGVSMIYSGFALTAASCASQFKDSSIFCGAVVYFGDLQFHAYDNFRGIPVLGIRYPGPYEMFPDSPADIAVLLFEPVICSTFSLPYQDSFVGEHQLWGWHHPQIDNLADYILVMSQIDFVIVENEECNTKYNVEVQSVQFCAKAKNDSQLVQKEDVGSPLVVDNFIVGVLSRIEDVPHAGDPVIFTKVYRYYIEILKIIGILPQNYYEYPEMDYECASGFIQDK